MSTEEDQPVSPQPSDSVTTFGTTTNIATENADGPLGPASSHCTVTTTASPPTSPLPDLIPNHPTPIFIPNPGLLSQMMEIGLPMEEASRCLYFTGNCSVIMALDWLEDHSNMVITEHDESYSLDMEEEMMLILVVNTSLNLSSGKLSLASAKATARLIIHVKETLGMETVVMWNQCGRITEVRGSKDSQEMERILAQVEIDRKEGMVRLMADFNKEGREREVLAVFGEVEDLQDMLGHLAIVK